MQKILSENNFHISQNAIIKNLINKLNTLLARVGVRGVGCPLCIASIFIYIASILSALFLWFPIDRVWSILVFLDALLSCPLGDVTVISNTHNGMTYVSGEQRLYSIEYTLITPFDIYYSIGISVSFILIFTSQIISSWLGYVVFPFHILTRFLISCVLTFYLCHNPSLKLRSPRYIICKTSSLRSPLCLRVIDLYLQGQMQL